MLCPIMKTDPNNHSFIDLYHFPPTSFYKTGQKLHFGQVILIHSMQKQQGGFFIVQNIF